VLNLLFNHLPSKAGSPSVEAATPREEVA